MVGSPPKKQSFLFWRNNGEDQENTLGRRHCTVEDLLMIKLNLEKVENIEKNNGVSVGLEKRKRLATEDDVEDNEVEVCVKKEN